MTLGKIVFSLLSIIIRIRIRIRIMEKGAGILPTVRKNRINSQSVVQTFFLAAVVVLYSVPGGCKKYVVKRYAFLK
jgi:hypothetical protein